MAHLFTSETSSALHSAKKEKAKKRVTTCKDNVKRREKNYSNEAVHSPLFSISPTQPCTRSESVKKREKIKAMEGINLVNLATVEILIREYKKRSDQQCDECNSSISNLTASTKGGVVTVICGCKCGAQKWKIKLAREMQIKYKKKKVKKSKNEAEEDSCSDDDGNAFDHVSDDENDDNSDTELDTDVEQDDSDVEMNTNNALNKNHDTDKVLNKNVEWKEGKSYDVRFVTVAAACINGLGHRSVQKNAALCAGNLMHYRTFVKNRDYYHLITTNIGKESLQHVRKYVKNNSTTCKINASGDGAWDHRRNARNHVYSVMTPVEGKMKVIGLGIVAKGVNYHGTSNGMEKVAADLVDEELVEDGVYYNSMTTDGDSSASTRVQDYNEKHDQDADSNRDRNHAQKNYEKKLDVGKAEGHDLWAILKSGDSRFTQPVYKQWTNNIKVNLGLILSEVCDHYKDTKDLAPLHAWFASCLYLWNYGLNHAPTNIISN
eukprot:1009747_1